VAKERRLDAGWLDIWHRCVRSCDVTAGHYYGQLMTNARASCRWPAAARFTELGIVAGYRPSFKGVDRFHCSVHTHLTAFQHSLVKLVRER